MPSDAQTFAYHVMFTYSVDSHNRACVCCPQGWFSPGQVFVLDEYCARYGVRGCHRHLCYLSDLLERAENGAMIDPTLLHYSFAFCASHVHGNRYKSNSCIVLGFSLSQTQIIIFIGKTQPGIGKLSQIMTNGSVNIYGHIYDAIYPHPLF